MKGQRVRLMIDFPDLESLSEWVVASREAGCLPDGSVAFRMDALDVTSVGITPANTYLIRRYNDRAEFFQLLAKDKDDPQS